MQTVLARHQADHCGRGQTGTKIVLWSGNAVSGRLRERAKTLALQIFFDTPPEVVEFSERRQLKFAKLDIGIGKGPGYPALVRVSVVIDGSFSIFEVVER